MPVDRRSIHQGAAATLVGAPGTLSPAAANSDPLVALIREYEVGTAAFNLRCASEEWDGLTEATYGPSMDRLCTNPPAPTTVAGALAGIDFVLSEMAAHIDSDANEAVLRVSAEFLRQQAGAAS